MTAPTVASADPADRPVGLPGAAPALLRPQRAPDLVVVEPARTLPAKRRLRPAVERAYAFLAPRWPLLLALMVITVLASQLIMSNTAFIDEGTYLSAGRTEWAHWLHGSLGPTYSNYFSGSPVIYPPLAAAANALGGLALARAMSLVFMLVTITLLYATSKRVFDARAAGWTVAIFATLNGTQFLASFATYDAMAMMLVAASVWVGVRYAHVERHYPHAGILIGVPILALANATKYATALFDPVVIVVVALVVLDRFGRKEAARIAVLFSAMLVSVLCAAVAMAGQNYQDGIDFTTLRRAGGDATATQVFDQSLRWIGWMALLSLLSIVACVVAWAWARHRGTGPRRFTGRHWLVVVTGAVVVLVPMEQAHIGTTVALHKHVTFGGWFAALAVGLMLAKLSGRALRPCWRWVPAVAAVGALVIVGYQQAQGAFHGWVNTSKLMASIEPYVSATHAKPVLMDEADIAKYYLGAGHPGWQWTPTYYFNYQVPGSSQTLSGAEAYRAAIRDGHFGLIALNAHDMPANDAVIQRAVEANASYEYLGEVHVHNADGVQGFNLWLDTAPAVTP